MFTELIIFTLYLINNHVIRHSVRLTIYQKNGMCFGILLHCTYTCKIITEYAQGIFIIYQINGISFGVFRICSWNAGSPP